MKNFNNLFELKDKFNKLLQKEERNKQIVNDEHEDSSTILRNLLKNGNVVISNGAVEVEDDQEDESSSSDHLTYLEDDDLEVDARKNIYEYSEQHLQKYDFRSKKRETVTTCPNWEEVDFKGSRNKPKVVDFVKRKPKK